METHTCRLMPRSFLLFAVLLMLPFVAISTARGDAAAELASFSAFPKVDLAQLSKGDAKPVRGGSSGSARYLSVQTVYVAPFPPAELLAKMRSWNPARHPELKVYLHIDSGRISPRSRTPPTIRPSATSPTRLRSVRPICNSAPRK